MRSKEESVHTYPAILRNIAYNLGIDYILEKYRKHDSHNLDNSSLLMFAMQLDIAGMLNPVRCWLSAC